MRRIYFAIFVAAICLLSSCTGPQGLPGRDGRDGRDGIDGPGITSIIIKVPLAYWEYSRLDNNNFYFATVDVPELTGGVCNSGLVKMYRVYGDTKNPEAQVELPYMRMKEEYVDEADDWAFYSEMVDYEFSVGKMTIFYTLSDFLYELDPGVIPEEMNFRCVIMY